MSFTDEGSFPWVNPAATMHVGGMAQEGRGVRGLTDAVNVVASRVLMDLRR